MVRFGTILAVTGVLAISVRAGKEGREKFRGNVKETLNDILADQSRQDELLTSIQGRLESSGNEATLYKNEVQDLKAELVSVKSGLQNARQDELLTSMQARLESSGNEATQCKSEVQDLKVKLVSVESDLQNAETELVSVKSGLKNAEAELVSVKSGLQNAEAELVSVKSELQNSKNSQKLVEDSLESKLNDLKRERESLKASFIGMLPSPKSLWNYNGCQSKKYYEKFAEDCQWKELGATATGKFWMYNDGQLMLKDKAVEFCQARGTQLLKFISNADKTSGTKLIDDAIDEDELRKVTFHPWAWLQNSDYLSCKSNDLRNCSRGSRYVHFIFGLYEEKKGRYSDIPDGFRFSVICRTVIN